MIIDISADEAAHKLSQIPVCIDCHRPATEIVRRWIPRKRGFETGSNPIESFATLFFVIAMWLLLELLFRWLRWPFWTKAFVCYPACARHRWTFLSKLQLVDAWDNWVQLDVASAEFLAAWELLRVQDANQNLSSDSKTASDAKENVEQSPAE